MFATVAEMSSLCCYVELGRRKVCVCVCVCEREREREGEILQWGKSRQVIA